MEKALTKIIPFFLLYYLVSCSTTQIEMEKKVKNKVEDLEGSVQMTFEGQNYMGAFSPDGTFIFFIRGDLDSGVRPQVFKLNVESKKVNRLTFNGGIDTGLSVFAYSQNFIYSSSADEEIEGSVYFDKASAKIDSLMKVDYLEDFYGFRIYKKNIAKISDLYLSDFWGRKIRRLTNIKGFDGFVTVDPKEIEIVFSSTLGKNLDLFRMNLKNNKIQQLTKNSGRHLEPKISPKGDLIIWLKRDDQKTQLVSSIWRQKSLKPHILYETNRFLATPFWHPSGEFIIFSVRDFDSKNSDIYLVKSDGSCLSKLVSSPYNETFPAFHPNGREFIYTSDREGSLNIYKKSFDISRSCPKEGVSTIIEGQELPKANVN